MNKMIAITIIPGATTATLRPMVSGRPVHHPAAGGDEHQEEGAERFGEESAPLLARVVEVVHRFDDVGLEPLGDL
ncbi:MULTISPECIES: hypothetical protein [Candidatus Neomicrothrix]|uniref:hypothetical protein n=1 Tax=Candidatus Neomicrothrix TaxID=41949 RepID=UPI001930BDFC|nr:MULTISPECIES: hypothetical protein [Microthrix]MBP6136106.1 hypothetical protein [Candidatus Microthrix sp.]MBP7852931.1 hypothetical protein [Candidatus Microthrix sp.]MBP7879122.1 hypothetical protein [Candidatus Microthrix sp.]MBP7996396.1 hypothetical protein [Candidatus Microthrix sp.]MBP8957383.1 hypothetical protein [Candidatus Microthrix sp.]